MGPQAAIHLLRQNNIYMQYEAEQLVAALCNTNSFQEKYYFTFLGKGWEKHVSIMRNSGYNVEHITFAPSYLEEIIKHDIQITPITIGTGTKGKVLDALANGLLVIGTPYALENIAVKHNDSCIIYNYPKDVINFLEDITNNRSKYEKMAEVFYVPLHNHGLVGGCRIHARYQKRKRSGTCTACRRRTCLHRRRVLLQNEKAEVYARGMASVCACGQCPSLLLYSVLYASRKINRKKVIL